MRINTVELTNVRGFTHAKLSFQPGFNLIVGINGAGKTTALESLRVLLSHILVEIKSPVITKDHFSNFDININTNSLQLNSSFTLDDVDFEFVYSKSAKYATTVEVKQPKRTKDSVANVREEGIILADIIDFKTPLKRAKEEILLGMFYSTRRSFIANMSPKASSSKLPHSPAFVEALSNTRIFNIRIFAEWFKVQKALAEENARYDKVIRLIKETIYSFLPEFSDLDLAEDEVSKELTFSIMKSGKALLFSQLSDGERGVLSLVFDIARRLIIANIDTDNPLLGKAVILIDELDLHLHPKWQRTIVGDLSRTFPNCQFIATTHSPQIIGEVKPESINIVDKSHVNEVYQPELAFGLDSQRILEEVLDVPIRNTDVDEVFSKLHLSVDDEKFKESKQLVAKLKKILGNYDPELIRINSMIQFLEEDSEDEKDS